MDLNYLITHYKPLYPEDQTWAATVEHMLTDLDDNKTVKQLMKVLKKEGKFRKPIRLGTASEINPNDEENDIEYDAVLNGTHRVCAHILTNTTTVYVEHEENTIPPEWDDNQEYLITTITFPPELTHKETNQIFDKLISIPVTKKLWITAEGMSQTNGEYEIMWDDQKEPYTKKQIKQINKKVTKKLTKLYPHHTPKIETFLTTFNKQYPENI